MSPANAVAVTVAAGTRRMDLVLPGGVPVAALANELADGFGVDPAVVRLARVGATLSPDLDLVSQGVEDGAVLWLAPARTPPPREYDDGVEVLADLSGGAHVPGWIRWLVLDRADRRQGDGAVDVAVLERELRLLTRLHMVIVLLVAAAALVVLARHV